MYVDDMKDSLSHTRRMRLHSVHRKLRVELGPGTEASPQILDRPTVARFKQPSVLERIVALSTNQHTSFVLVDCTFQEIGVA